jgi:hypothetical protein
VPYGLHGSWFGERQVVNQRPVETIRGLTGLQGRDSNSDSIWMSVRGSIENFLA